MSRAMEHAAVIVHNFITRRALARLLSTFVCALTIVLRPFSHLGGQYAFLVLTVNVLVFGAQEDLAQQLEATVLNVAGSLLAIWLSALGIYLASTVGEESASSRALQAAWLVLIVFGASVAKSRLPRLALSSRITMFVAIFMLTANIGNRRAILPTVYNWLWVVLTPAVVSLVSCSLVLTWSSAGFARDIVSSLALARQTLELALDHEDHSQKRPAAYVALFQKSVALSSKYQQASFELRMGRMSVKAVKPMLSVVEMLRRELVCMSLKQVPETVWKTSELSRFTTELERVAVQSLVLVERTILEAYREASLLKSPVSLDVVLIEKTQRDLKEAQRSMRAQLQEYSHRMDVERHPDVDGQEDTSQDFAMCLFVVSLLQMTDQVGRALEIVHGLSVVFNRSSMRLWVPHLSYAWLGVTPRHYVLEAAATDEGSSTSPDTRTGPRANLSLAEASQGVKETEAKYQASVKSSVHGGFASVLRRLPSLVHHAWSSKRALRARLWLSKLLRSAQHSDHVKHGLKNAAGVALLSLPAFLQEGAAGRTWFRSVHGIWMVISYMWILETSTGATWRSSYLRLCGTITGAVYAYVTWAICRRNPYGLVAMLTLAEIPITAFVLFTSAPALGVVAAITLPPIALNPYVNLESTQPVIKIAVDRGLMIGAGIIAALFVNSWLFPRHARVVFLDTTGSILGSLSSYYLELSRETIGKGFDVSMQGRRRVLRIELLLRGMIHNLGGCLVAMSDELSLMPKPIGLYRDMARLLRSSYDLLCGLRKVRQRIPRHEAVISVHHDRHDLMASVGLSFYALENAFRNRRPLPQFIPSARHAFNTLQSHVPLRLREGQMRAENPLESSLVWAMAESELLEGVVDNLEQMLELSRALFGSDAWLEESVQAMKEHEEMTGWFSTVSRSASRQPSRQPSPHRT